MAGRRRMRRPADSFPASRRACRVDRRRAAAPWQGPAGRAAAPGGGGPPPPAPPPPPAATPPPQPGNPSADQAPRVRTNFPETLYANPEIITGPDGKATISLDM